MKFEDFLTRIELIKNLQQINNGIAVRQTKKTNHQQAEKKTREGHRLGDEIRQAVMKIILLNYPSSTMRLSRIQNPWNLKTILSECYAKRNQDITIIRELN